MIGCNKEKKIFEAVIFDWDGTLADTRDVIVLSFQKLLGGLGCRVSDAYLEKQIGIGARNMLKNALATSKISFNDKDIDKLMEEYKNYRVKLADQVELFNGVRDLLASLFTKVKIGLATMSNRKIINIYLKKTGIRHFFDNVITADEVQLPKPDPQIFLECAMSLKCHPERCVVLEDSIYGIIAARKANMKCIAIPSGAYSVEKLRTENPDMIVFSINDKEKILNFVLRAN